MKNREFALNAAAASSMACNMYGFGICGFG